MSTEDPTSGTIDFVTRAPAAAEDLAPPPASASDRRMAAEIFLKAAGPALVKQVSEILQTREIPLMPLKGVLLQKLVYGENSFRPISDVDVLVPEERFVDAHAALRIAGFTAENWEVGRWQVTLRNPARPPLGIDLHRRLTRTSRSNLTAQGMFQRASANDQLFGAPVLMPCAEDLFAHLLLHATLHWLNMGSLHHPEDFDAVASALALDADRCAKHLAGQGLLTHARLMLPLISAQAGGGFAHDLASRIPATPRTRLSSWMVGALAARYRRPGHAGRRLASLALAPSLSRAIATAVRDRLGRQDSDQGV